MNKVDFSIYKQEDRMRKLFVIIFIALLDTLLSANTLSCQTNEDKRGFIAKSVIKASDKFDLRFDLYNAYFNGVLYEYKETINTSFDKSDIYVNGQKKLVLTTQKSVTAPKHITLEIENFYKEFIDFECKKPNILSATPARTDYASFLDKNKVLSEIQDSYGDTFNKLSPNERKYILDNREIMRRITQQVLNRVSRVNISNDLQFNSSNIVEFYIYPNGHISDILFVETSKLNILNLTTKDTIEYSYSKYPHPEQKTLLRYKFTYESD